MILTVGFRVGYFYCFYTKTSNVTSIQLPAWGFCQRGRKKHESIFCAHFRHLQKKAYLGGSGCGEERRWGRKGEAELEVQSSCRSGSVGQGHAARAHMESRLQSSADSNCPSMVDVEQHVSRQRKPAARARYQSPSWFALSKREAWHEPAV